MRAWFEHVVKKMCGATQMPNEAQEQQPDNETLLKEYELCQNAAQSLETPIWQTSAAIGIGSMGTLVMVVTAERPLPLIPTIIIGVFVCFVIRWLVALGILANHIPSVCMVALAQAKTEIQPLPTIEELTVNYQEHIQRSILFYSFCILTNKSNAQKLYPTPTRGDATWKPKTK